MLERLTKRVFAVVQQEPSSDHEESGSRREDVLPAGLRMLIRQDEYGRILRFRMKTDDTVEYDVDGANDKIITLFDSVLRERISDACGELFYSEYEYSFLFSFDRRVEGIFEEGGSLVAAAQGAGEEDEAEIWVPSPAIPSDNYVDWAKTMDDDELPMTKRLEEFGHLCTSAEWLVSRVIRGELLFEMGGEWSDLKLIVGRDDRSHASHLRRKPAFFIKLNLVPDTASFVPSGSKDWPEFEIDLLTSEDHLVLLERSYSGKWRSSRPNAISRMAELTEKHQLIMTDRRGVKTSWPTNLYRRMIKNKGLAAIWSPDWRSSCGYEINVVDEYKFDLST